MRQLNRLAEFRNAVCRENPAYNAALAKEGVTCVTCHVRDGTILTAHRTSRANVPHALSYSPAMRKAEFCGGCHQFNVASPRRHPFERPPSNRRRVVAARADVQPLIRHAVLQEVPPAPPARGDTQPPADPETPPVPPQPDLESQYQQETREQSTLSEFHASPAAIRGASCQSCHMPTGSHGRRHTWPGRDSEQMLRQAVSLTARLDRRAYRPGETLQAVITLRNDAGHRFPTGDSIHAGILDVWLQDGDRTLGRQVFVMSRQQSRFSRFLEERGMIVFQHFNGKLQPGISILDRLEGPGRSDTRLLPGEEAMLVYQRPVDLELARCRALTLRVRVFHSALHPGFRGSRIDPGLNTLRLIRELRLPVQLEPESPTAEARVALRPIPREAGGG